MFASETFAAQKLVTEKYKEIQTKLEKDKAVSGFLPFLLAADLSQEEVYANIAEIMLGAVDTVSIQPLTLTDYTLLSQIS